TPNNTQHTPNEIKRMALKQLRETRSAMMESEYLLALKDLPDDERQEAAAKLSEVQSAYLQLRKAKLRDIHDRLIANEQDLESSIASLQHALQKLHEVREIVSAAATLLRVAARMLNLI
ncbi:MAG: hypothetical protein ACYS76_14675, partial [Planctomycetota bacterium]